MEADKGGQLAVVKCTWEKGGGSMIEVLQPNEREREKERVDHQSPKADTMGSSFHPII